MAKPWAARLCRLPKQDFFVAQDIIKVKIYSVAELRYMKKSLPLIMFSGAFMASVPSAAQTAKATTDKPNVILVYADDMGMGMLSCLGQRQIMTPNIDRVFRQGTQFTHAYGCMVSAASRASLLTGYSDIRKEKIRVSGGGQLLLDPATVTDKQVAAIEANIDRNDVNLPAGDLYLPQVFKKADYVTGEIGKLEYGWTATRNQMTRHGWDYYYGYLDHVGCHGYYPPFVFENGKVVSINGNTHKDCAKTGEPETDATYAARWNMEGKTVYSQDLFDAKMKEFIRENKDRPFFLFHPSQLPHGPVMIPSVNPQVKDNPNLTQIEKEYASMVLRLDSVVGMLLDEVEVQGIADKTMFIFASDNGHEIYYAKSGRVSKPFGAYDDWNTKYYSDTHGDVFNGNGSLRGFKRQNSEGGPRIPLAMYLPGKIPAGVRCDQFVSMFDLIPTFADMLGVKLSSSYPKDGISILPTIMHGDSIPKKRTIAYSSYQGPAIVSNEGYKVRYNTIAKDYDMYYLLDDPQERKNVAGKYPEKLEELKALLLKACDGNIDKGKCGY